MRTLEERLLETESHTGSSVSSQTNQQNNNCTVNNIQNNININLSPHAFGRENWSYLSDKEIFRIMSGVNSCIPSLVEKLHFDVNHPENHNIKIQNKSKSELKVFDGHMWRTQDKNATVDELINNIRGKFDDYEDTFLSHTSKGIGFQWENYWHEMKQPKKQKEMRKKVIGTISDCQDMIQAQSQKLRS